MSGVAEVKKGLGVAGFLCQERAEMRERADAGTMSYIEVKELCDMAHTFRARVAQAICEYRISRIGWMAQEDIKLSYRVATIDIERMHVQDLVRMYRMINADFHYCYRQYMAALAADKPCLLPAYITRRRAA